MEKIVVYTEEGLAGALFALESIAEVGGAVAEFPTLASEGRKAGWPEDKPYPPPLYIISYNKVVRAYFGRWY